MIDHFAALRQIRRPWLDPEKLKEEYHQLTLAEHPDRGDRRADASGEFAAVNEAY
ncbi:MAG: DnaJ domain, partial [Verrucomicrobiota bacterium]